MNNKERSATIAVADELLNRAMEEFEKGDKFKFNLFDRLADELFKSVGE